MRADWGRKPLGDVCEIVGGGTPSKRKPEFYEGDIPWATVRDMKNEVLSSTELCISKEAVSKSSTKIIPGNSVVIATRVGLGKVCLIEQDTAINQDLRGLIPKRDDLCIRFLFRWLQSIANRIKSAGTGATVTGVTLPFIRSLQIPVPPLSEQRRIVAIIDEAFASIDTAIANTETNLANFGKLFESCLNSTFEESGDGWRCEKLNELIDITHGYAFKSKDFQGSQDRNKPIVLTPGNYLPSGDLYFTSKNTKRLAGSYPEGYRFSKGDLTIVMTDLSSKMKILGKPAFIERDDILHNQRIGRIRFKSKAISPRLLYYFLMTNKAIDEVKRTATGTTARHTAPKRILNIRMRFPVRTSEQDCLVSRLDSIKERVIALEELYQQKLTCFEELKASLLRKGFNGELTSGSVRQDIDRAMA